jgi:hypothetical protein
MVNKENPKPKRKLTLTEVLIAFFIFVIIVVIGNGFVGRSSDSESNKVAIETTLTCTEATSEDLDYLTEGLADTSLSLTKAFKSYFNANDREEIKAIYSTFTNPYVVAAQIDGAGEGSNIGLWSIQRFDFGAIVFALNENAKLYSLAGADISDDSRSGRTRAKILELSSNTSALECAGN